MLPLMWPFVIPPHPRNHNRPRKANIDRHCYISSHCLVFLNHPELVLKPYCDSATP